MAVTQYFEPRYWQLLRLTSASIAASLIALIPLLWSPWPREQAARAFIASALLLLSRDGLLLFLDRHILPATRRRVLRKELLDLAENIGIHGPLRPLHYPPILRQFAADFSSKLTLGQLDELRWLELEIDRRRDDARVQNFSAYSDATRTRMLAILKNLLDTTE